MVVNLRVGFLDGKKVYIAGVNGFPEIGTVSLSLAGAMENITNAMAKLTMRDKVERALLDEVENG